MTKQRLAEFIPDKPDLLQHRIKQRHLTILNFGLLVLMASAITSPAYAAINNQIFSAVAESKFNRYEATIRRTSHGIPHINAKNLASAWFGQGYAMAEDRICVVLDQIIKIRSERSRFFGAGFFNSNLDSDFGYKLLGLMASAHKDWRALPQSIREMLTAHAAGINQYVANKGVANLPEPCRNAEWIVKVTPIDLLAYSMDVALLNSGRFLLPFLSNAAPPSANRSIQPVSATQLSNKETSPGSNGWGLGKAYTNTGNSMLLAQPHFPWEGDLQSWESHVTVPGQLDIYGITLPGIPNTMVGFNKKVAWTLTVTTSPKATLYKLSLVPGNPTQYLYDGQIRDMTPTLYKVAVRQDDGSLEEQSRTLYRSHYGPMLSIPGFLIADFADYSWNSTVAMTYRDANINNRGLLSQFLAMSQASSLDSFINAHQKWNSIPWSNTIAVSSEGQSWYGDSSPVPQISTESYQAWQQARFFDPGVFALFEFHGIYALDGRTSRDEWQTTAINRPGLIPFADAPQLTRPDYVFNSNDSHWLINPNQLLEGYNPLFGAERETLALRTRMNAIALSDTGGDGKFSMPEMQEAALNNRSLTGELLKSDLVQRCTATPSVQLGAETIDLSGACAVLAAWDETFDLDSEGAVLFREFLGSFDLFGHATFTGDGIFFANHFDANNPIYTPSALSTQTLPGVGDLMLNALAKAVKRLTDNGFALNSVLRDSQYTVKGDKRIPIHGGNAREGIMNLVGYSGNSTLFPTTPRDSVINFNTGLTGSGYVVNYGTSFLMAVELTPKGPVCNAITTFSQSADPASPFYSDQTEMYSNKQWRPCLYNQQQIKSDPGLKTYKVTRH